jgi:hypothetical protein
MLRPDPDCPHCRSLLKGVSADRALCLGCRALLKWDGSTWVVSTSLVAECQRRQGAKPSNRLLL